MKTQNQNSIKRQKYSNIQFRYLPLPFFLIFSGGFWLLTSNKVWISIGTVTLFASETERVKRLFGGLCLEVWKMKERFWGAKFLGNRTWSFGWKICSVDLGENQGGYSPSFLHYVRGKSLKGYLSLITISGVGSIYTLKMVFLVHCFSRMDLIIFFPWI